MTATGIRVVEDEFVKIADLTAHRALSYVDAINKHGYALSVDEFEAYIMQPTRGGGRTGWAGRSPWF